MKMEGHQVLWMMIESMLVVPASGKVRLIRVKAILLARDSTEQGHSMLRVF